MDDTLKRLEERLEALVPKGISDHGRQRMEDTIDGLAAATTGACDGTSGASFGTWRWAVGAAACLGVAAGVALLRGPEDPGPVAMTVGGTTVQTASIVPAAYEPEIETMATSLRVDGRFDEGWVIVGGGELPHRYWGYDLTHEEEVVDAESGFTVRIYSEREEWVPVKLTSL